MMGVDYPKRLKINAERLLVKYAEGIGYARDLLFDDVDKTIYLKLRNPIREHICDFCGAPIETGDKYYGQIYPRWLGYLAESHFHNWKLCIKCVTEMEIEN